MANPIVSLIVQGARARNIDPAAALAVARQEGLSGGIGDNGHAYGPFQLNNAGGVITGIRPGVNSPAVQAWATSPQGINFALGRIARVASGKRGADAVRAIVSQFERPADPAGEIARALAALPSYSGAPAPAAKIGGAPGPLPAVAAPPAPDLSLLAAGASLFGFDPAPLEALVAQQKAQAPTRQPRAAVPAAKPEAKPMKRGSTIRFLEHIASPYGLTVTSTTGGKHVKNSWHYKGRAIDVAGDPAKMQALAEYALQHPTEFREMFYDPIGLHIKNGKIIKGAIGGHSDHVHLAA